MNQQKKGVLILVSAPSGGGKNAIIHELMKRFPSAVQLVTTTTRPMRVGEQDGVDYYFISKEQFQTKLDHGEFVEHNEYAGNFYGTEWEKLRTAQEGHSLVFSQAEVNGKQSLDRLKVPHISVFLLPESLDILEQRLRKRGGMAEENIEERLRIGASEIALGARYDLAVVNREGRMEDTVEQIERYLRQRLT